MTTELQRREIARSLASKAVILPPLFSDCVQDLWERDMCACIVEARIGGRRTIARWAPLTRRAYEDDAVRGIVARMAQSDMPQAIEDVLVNNPNIIGPRGSLPL